MLYPGWDPHLIWHYPHSVVLQTKGKHSLSLKKTTDIIWVAQNYIAFTVNGRFAALILIIFILIFFFSIFWNSVFGFSKIYTLCWQLILWICEYFMKLQVRHINNTLIILKLWSFMFDRCSQSTKTKAKTVR